MDLRGCYHQGPHRPGPMDAMPSVSTFDFDDDGWPDIYVACDSAPNILYHNNRDGLSPMWR